VSETASSIQAQQARAVARPRARGRGLDLQDPRAFGAALVLPAQLLLLFIVVFPTLSQLYISFTSWSPTRGGNWWDAYLFWNWLGNYWDLIRDPVFLGAILRTAIIVAIAVPLEFLIGLRLAFLFLNEFRGKRVFYTFMLLPMMIVPSVTGYIFFMLFQANGPINAALSLVLRRPVEITWLANEWLAPLAVIIADVWQWTPLMFLILYSGLLALPDDQLRAAEVLGASEWQIFRMLILPMLKPIIVIALIIRGMEALKIFDSIWLMTAGGPARATESISVYLFKVVFQTLNWSQAAAAAIIVLILVSIAATFALRPLQQAEQQSEPVHEGEAR